MKNTTNNNKNRKLHHQRLLHPDLLPTRPPLPSTAKEESKEEELRRVERKSNRQSNRRKSHRRKGHRRNQTRIWRPICFNWWRNWNPFRTSGNSERSVSFYLVLLLSPSPISFCHWHFYPASYFYPIWPCIGYFYPTFTLFLPCFYPTFTLFLPCILLSCIILLPYQICVIWKFWFFLRFQTIRLSLYFYYCYFLLVSLASTNIL